MIPLELLTGGISFALGAATKIIAMKMEMKHAEQKALLQKAGIVHEVRKFGTQDLNFAWTRRVIALTLLAIVASPVWAPFIGDIMNIPIAVAIPVVDETNTSVLWGMFSYTDKVMAYKHITTITYLPEYNHYFFAVIGMYFGVNKK